MLDDQRAILFAQTMECAGQLDVILPVGRLDRDRAIARRIVDLDCRRELAGTQPLPGSYGIDLGDRDEVARAGFADLDGFLALHLEEGPAPCMTALVNLKVGALCNPPAQSTGDRQPADRSVNDLEHVER